MQERAFGRLERPDPRDSLFSVSASMPAAPVGLRSQEWWDDGWWGDQGTSTECVAYSWLHLLEDGPVVQDAARRNGAIPLISPDRLYKECQLRDPWAGEGYPGTSVRAGAGVLRDLGIISEYRWAHTIDEVVNTLLVLGPMVVGTKWFEGMNKPDSSGLIRPVGRYMGGHAYVINGVNLDKKLIRIKNSWGKGWGHGGHAFITFRDFATLLNQGGEACIAIERKLTEELDWSKLRVPGIYNV